jgi:hypothetical protein
MRSKHDPLSQNADLAHFAAWAGDRQAGTMAMSSRQLELPTNKSPKIAMSNFA